MRLLIVSHVVHYQWEGQIWAFGGYAREIEIWADLFTEVLIASPLRHEAPPGDHLPFEHANIQVWPIAERGGGNFKAKMWQIVSLPGIIFPLIRAMRTVDAIHVRCPGNIGLLGLILAPMFSSYRVAKYAGQWNGYEGEGFPTRLQRKILKSSWWGAPVTVYGQWPNQPANVIPFFTSMMTKSQTEIAAKFAMSRSVGQVFNILFVGRLTDVKRVDVLLEAFSIFIHHNQEAELTIIGDGPERNTLEKQCQTHQILPYVKFIGALPYDDALKWYEWADCLVLPSTHSEGWPKVIAEAMCYGVHCIAVKHGQLPYLLENRGTLVEHGTADEFAAALLYISKNREYSLDIAKRASSWSSNYSIEYLKQSLQELLEHYWRISFNR